MDIIKRTLNNRIHEYNDKLVHLRHQENQLRAKKEALKALDIIFNKFVVEEAEESKTISFFS